MITISYFIVFYCFYLNFELFYSILLIYISFYDILPTLSNYLPDKEASRLNWQVLTVMHP